MASGSFPPSSMCGSPKPLGITPGLLGIRCPEVTLGGFGGAVVVVPASGGRAVAALGEDSKASGAVSPGLRSSWCLSPSFSPSSSSSYHLLLLVEKIPGSSRVGNPFPVGAGGARSSITWRSHYNPFPTRWKASKAFRLEMPKGVLGQGGTDLMGYLMG